MNGNTGNGIDDDCNPLTSDIPPIPAFSYTPEISVVGGTVFFIDESTDPDGYIVSWGWDFGDGETSTQQHPVHSYAHSGVYTVTLTVAEESGNRESISKNITVLGPPDISFTASKEMSVAKLSEGASITEYSSVYSTASSYQPQNLIDESTSSSWRTASGQASDQWVTIDLAGDLPHSISKVKFYKTNSSYNLKNFEIRISVNGIEFTTVLTGTLPEETGWYEFDISPVIAARYVQLYVIDSQGSASYLIIPHFEVLTPDRQGGIVSLLHGLPARTVDYSAQSSSSSSPDKLLDENAHRTGRLLPARDQSWVKIELGGGQSHIIDRLF